MRVVLIATLCAMVTAHVSAEEVPIKMMITGSVLKQMCELDASEVYLAGVIDTAYLFHAAGHGGELCFPSWFTSATASQIACQAVSESEDRLSEPAASVALEAFMTAFKC